MGFVKCPKCGEKKCQLVQTGKHHGIIYFLIFGIFWLFYAFFKWCIGLCVAFCFDWWMAIVYKIRKKAYYWHCKKWFTSRSAYYCPDCGYNFKA